MKIFKLYNNIIFKKIFLFLNIIILYIIILYISFDSNFIYVTLTSWKTRINFIHKNLESLLSNKIKPKKIILNLSVEEFPKKNLDLPLEILNLLEKYRNFEIFWVDKNTKVFKKLIPTLNRYKKGIIITVDDDILYPNDLIEKMLKCYKKLGGNSPVTFGTKHTDWEINGKIIHSHYGRGSIVSYKYFNNKINELYKYTTEDLINKGFKCPDDLIYTYAALLNGYKYKRCKDYFIKVYDYIPPKLSNPFSEFKNQTYVMFVQQYNNIVKEFIKNHYNISIDQLIEKTNNKKYFKKFNK